MAQNRYAKLLAVGEGVSLDLEGSGDVALLARRQGLTDAVLDKLLVSIPPGDLAKAEERARFWPSAPPTDATPTLTAPAAGADNSTVPFSGTTPAPAQKP